MPRSPHPTYPGWPCLRLLWMVVLLSGAALGIAAEGADIRGMPFSRTYSLDEIGNVPRKSRLGFDAFGRLAVIHDNVYAVLNDTVWLNLADIGQSGGVAITNVVQGPDGVTYYAGMGSWGRADIQADGLLHTTPLVPVNPPAWTRAIAFEDVLVTQQGVYFCSREGVVFWDTTRKECAFFEVEKSSKIFRAGDKIFSSRFQHPLLQIDGPGHTVHEMPSAILDGMSRAEVVERATEFDGSRALLSMLDGQLLVFDGAHAAPWPGQARNNLTGRILSLRYLADGNIAVSIAERGVFVLSPDGDLLSSLTIPQYHVVSDIVSREPGVMWLINESSIEKILYGSHLTGFDQRLGLAPEYPLVASWRDSILVGSGGLLYKSTAPAPGLTARFDRVDLQPPYGTWSLAAWGQHLLIGNPSGIYAVTPEWRYDLVAVGPEFSYLMMVDENTCFAIGPTEIAALVWNGGQWTEPVPRIPGVRNPALVHRAGRSAWIETGGDGVVRVSLQGGRLHLMRVPNEPWTKALWVNIGVVEDTVILSGARGDRRFFNEATGDWSERPDLARLLERSSAWLARVRNDSRGNLWATHNEGIVKFTPKDGSFEMDELSYDLINDRYPVVHVLPDNEVWVSASRSLYHVENPAGAPTRAAGPPVLVSVMDARRNLELVNSLPPTAAGLQVPYNRNSLTFRFFSGSYAWRRTPRYEFRLNEREPWATLGTGSLLQFPGLPEGSYRLQVRTAGQPATPAAVFTLPFEVLPPWYRTGPAYLTYVVLLLLVALGVIRWSGQLARKRNRALEQLVQERTSQLESTMVRLSEETHASATLAERNRFAGEIHDSVQQGLTGAIIHLDTTLTLPIATGDLGARLHVVRNMVSYARQEVQHAIWDMESPLLKGSDLGGALRKLSTYVTSNKVAPRVEVTGEPADLPRATMHNLIRIAQEATTNALRHARAGEIILRLNYQADGIELVIADDGAGFQPDAVLNQAGHFGLRGIRTRAKKLGGTLNITSAPGEGTSVRVVVPRASLSSHEPHSKNSSPLPNPNLAGR